MCLFREYPPTYHRWYVYHRLSNTECQNSSNEHSQGVLEGFHRAPRPALSYADERL